MGTGADAAKKPIIVLVHKVWQTPRSWEAWMDRFQKAGHDVLAPSWPGVGAEAEEIRVSRSALVGSVRLDAVVDHYERIIRSLETPPILMGHSSGGVIVRLLVERGLGAAGVVIDQAEHSDVPAVPLSGFKPPHGTFGKSFALRKGVPLSEAARMLKEGAFSLVNPKARSKASLRSRGRAPILVIDGTKGHGKSTLAQPGWEEVADFALQWAMENSRDRMTVDQVKAAFAPPVLTESREHQVLM